MLKDFKGTPFTQTIFAFVFLDTSIYNFNIPWTPETSYWYSKNATFEKKKRKKKFCLDSLFFTLYALYNEN